MSSGSNDQWKEKGYRLAVRTFMLCCTVLALIGLGALVFFMCEQGMLEYGITSMGLVHVTSAIGAAIVFLAHVTTWGKASLAFADKLTGVPDEVKASAQVKYTTNQKLVYALLVFFALLGTMVYAASSFLGFLSMASALSAAGAWLTLIKVFGIACCVAMYISGGAFNIYSMTEELDKHFDLINKRDERRKNRKVPDTDEFKRRVRSYTSIKRKYNIIADTVTSILAIGNGLGDVLFKSFALSHFLVLLGLAAVASTGVITFSYFGMVLLVTGAVSTFVLSIATEGIRMMAIGREWSQAYREPHKRHYFPEQLEIEAKPTTKLSEIGQFLGRGLAVFVSFLQAVPTFTSSVSKVAGLGALMMWLMPSMPGLALGLSISLGAFFFVSKFIGYLGQSGPYIVTGIAAKTDSMKQDMQQSYSRLEREFRNYSSRNFYYKIIPGQPHQHGKSRVRHMLNHKHEHGGDRLRLHRNVTMVPSDTTLNQQTADLSFANTEETRLKAVN